MTSPETFWTLLHDAAHWEFELFLMAVFDGIVGCLLWPFIRKHWNHHVAHDRRDAYADAMKPRDGYVPVRYDFFMQATDSHGKILGPRIKI